MYFGFSIMTTGHMCIQLRLTPSVIGVLVYENILVIFAMNNIS